MVATALSETESLGRELTPPKWGWPQAISIRKPVVIYADAAMPTGMELGVFQTTTCPK